MFQVKHVQPDRGAAHVGHCAIELSETFADVRERLLARSSTDGVVLDFGEAVSLTFTDPDGFMAEVLTRKSEPWGPAIPAHRGRVALGRPTRRRELRLTPADASVSCAATSR